mmetsp:Transcript_114850/g.245190  ORF Transcript_114850/g.245190 Transcript_114850/m.245190 type:complete len:299 (-) Transcript_114850:107-1003(-)
MGAAALIADAGSVCLPLALGTAVGSAWTSAQERCGQRICVVGAVPMRCTDIACMAPKAIFAVSVMVHDADVVQGVIGTFQDNEPVIGIRAQTLPYTQAIGHRAAAGWQWEQQQCELPMPERSMAARLLFGGGASWTAALGDTPAFDTYSFSDFHFTLPGMSLKDEVVVAFGVRTVVRVPVLWGASNAPLDFNVLGTIGVALEQLLHSPQPVKVLVPIHRAGEPLPHMVRTSLTFRVAPSEQVVAPSAHDASHPLSGRNLSAMQELPVNPGDLLRCDTEDIELQIRSLEEELQVLRSRG